MAVTHWNATRTVAFERTLHDRPWAFDFYWALRCIEALHPDQPRLGRSVRPADDPVRLGQPPSMAFPPAPLSAFTPAPRGGKGRLDVTFFGLFGPNGALPLHLTEYARDRLRNADDPTLSQFADLFHHRMLSLLYRAWADAQPATGLDRIDADSGRFAGYVASLCGYGERALRHRDAMPDLAKLAHAGQLGSQSHNAEGLETLLGNFFGLPFRVEQFVGHDLHLPADARCQLGESPHTGLLGRTMVLGERVWDCQGKFRIEVGPLTLDAFRRLLPDRPSLGRMVAIVRNYCGDELVWDLKLRLIAEQRPPLRLGSDSRLGWTSWFGQHASHEGTDDVLVVPLEERQMAT